MSLAFALSCDERPRSARARAAAFVFLLVASGWSAVLLDRGGRDGESALWLVVLGVLGLAGTRLAYLIIGRMGSAGGETGCGVLQVDARGRTFWIPGADFVAPGWPSSGGYPSGPGRSGLSLSCDRAAIEVGVARWHRREADAWIRLVPLAADSPRPVDLTLVEREFDAQEWAAVCRWLMWLERRAGPQ